MKTEDHFIDKYALHWWLW